MSPVEKKDKEEVAVKKEVVDVKKEEVAVKLPGKKDKVRRVFRVEKPPMNESLYTVLIPPRVIDGMSFPAVAKSVQPTSAQQYILDEGAEHYDMQLQAFRKYEDLGLIKEVSAEDEGTPYIPPVQVKIKALEDELKKLRLEL